MARHPRPQPVRSTEWLGPAQLPAASTARLAELLAIGIERLNVGAETATADTSGAGSGGSSPFDFGGEKSVYTDRGTHDAGDDDEPHR